MTTPPQVVRDYAAALQAYLDDPSEEGLAAAYAIGRRAVNEGASVLDLLAAHGETVRSLFDVASAARMKSAIGFLYECLAPLEMAYRGFIEANAALRDVNVRLEDINATLERTVQDRTAQLAQALSDVKAHAEARQRYARDVNDSIVQVLVAAETSADLGYAEESRRLLGEASRAARAWIGEQLLDVGPLRPGVLVRARAAEHADAEAAETGP